MIYCFRVVISYSTLPPFTHSYLSLCVCAPLRIRRAFSQMMLVTIRDFSSVSKVTPGLPKTISPSLVHTPHRKNDSIYLFIFFVVDQDDVFFFSFCHVYNIETEMIQPQDLEFIILKGHRPVVHHQPARRQKGGLVWIGISIDF